MATQNKNSTTSNLRIDSYLEIVDIDNKISRKGVNYSICTYEKINIRGEERIFSGIKANRIVFGDNCQIYKIGSRVRGDIKVYKTTEYTKEGDFFNSISVVVLTDENGIVQAAKILDYYNAFPYDEDGNIYQYKLG